jgi:hypothetical protein
MLAVAISSQSVAQNVASALRAAVAHLPAAGKQVSRMTGKCPRTIRNLLEAQNAPSAATLIELMRDFDEVYEAVLSMAQRNPQAPSGANHQDRIEQAMKILGGGNHEINTDRSPQMVRPID